MQSNDELSVKHGERRKAEDKQTIIVSILVMAFYLNLYDDDDVDDDGNDDKNLCFKGLKRSCVTKLLMKQSTKENISALKFSISLRFIIFPQNFVLFRIKSAKFVIIDTISLISLKFYKKNSTNSTPYLKIRHL